MKQRVISTIILCIACLSGIVFFSPNVSRAADLAKKTFQIHNTYDQSVTSLTCYEDKEGNVLLPLTDILTPAGFTVEECPRCGKDEVYSKENENNNGLGHYFVNWYQKLLSYSVSDKTLSLSAANEKVGGKTYCPKDAFEYMGVSVNIDTKALTVTVSDKKIRGIYFYSSTCDSCEKIDKFLDTIDEKYPDCRISRYDIYDTANYDLLQEYGKVYQVPDEKKGFTPSLYISDKVLIGAEIQAELEQAVRDYEKGPATKILLADETTQTTTPVSGSKAAQIFSALGAGLINGLNPCSLSIFLFLLSLLLVDQKYMLRSGFGFILGKTLMFFLLGTLLYNVIRSVNTKQISAWLNVFMIVFALLFAALNLWDFFTAKKENFGGMKLQLPKALRKKNEGLLKWAAGHRTARLSGLLLFFIGMIVATGEFLCTGQIYLSSVVILVQKGSAGLFPVLLLLLYSIAFVIPLIVLMLVLYISKKYFEASEFILDKIPLIKLISSLLFVAMAVYLILS